MTSLILHALFLACIGLIVAIQDGEIRVLREAIARLERERGHR